MSRSLQPIEMTGGHRTFEFGLRNDHRGSHAQIFYS